MNYINCRCVIKFTDKFYADNFIDWERLEKNGVCKWSESEAVGLSPRALGMVRERIEALPFQTLEWRDLKEMRYCIQRAHCSTAWTGRGKPRKYPFAGLYTGVSRFTLIRRYGFFAFPKPNRDLRVFEVPRYWLDLKVTLALPHWIVFETYRADVGPQPLVPRISVRKSLECFRYSLRVRRSSRRHTRAADSIFLVYKKAFRNA